MVLEMEDHQHSGRAPRRSGAIAIGRKLFSSHGVLIFLSSQDTHMSYYDLPTGDADVELGRTIYMEALDDRRGGRYDQLGIEDIEIWSEIFDAIGRTARSAV